MESDLIKLNGNTKNEGLNGAIMTNDEDNGDDLIATEASTQIISSTNAINYCSDEDETLREFKCGANNEALIDTEAPTQMPQEEPHFRSNTNAINYGSNEDEISREFKCGANNEALIDTEALTQMPQEQPNFRSFGSIEDDDHVGIEQDRSKFFLGVDRLASVSPNSYNLSRLASSNDYISSQNDHNRLGYDSFSGQSRLMSISPIDHSGSRVSSPNNLYNSESNSFRSVSPDLNQRSKQGSLIVNRISRSSSIDDHNESASGSSAEHSRFLSPVVQRSRQSSPIGDRISRSSSIDNHNESASSLPAEHSRSISPVVNDRTRSINLSDSSDVFSQSVSLSKAERSRSGSPYDQNRSRSCSSVGHRSRSVSSDNSIRSSSASPAMHTVDNGSVPNRSRSGSPVDYKENDEVSDSDDIGIVKKRVIRQAFGSDDDNEDADIKKSKINASDDGQLAVSEDENPPEKEVGSALCDFDLMRERQKANRRSRKRKDIDLINDNDDAIAKLIVEMRMAAARDRDLNIQQQPATKKISLLRTAMAQLNKVNLQMAFIEANVLSVLTEWLSPMPDKSLPTVHIREHILKFLYSIHIDDQSRLKESGIGKAVMYLYKHPKELRRNKILAGRIISVWARPLFNLSTDYKTLSAEERIIRDNKIEHFKKAEADEQPETGLRPGDDGWCYRARVPQPAAGSYVIRPEWSSNVDISRPTKREMTSMEKHMKNAQENRKRLLKNRRAVNISIEGRKMPL